MQRVMVVAGVVLALALGARAAEVPTLTRERHLVIELLKVRIENAQLKAQLAQREFEAAKAELLAQVDAARIEGYELDLTTLTYVPTGQRGAQK